MNVIYKIGPEYVAVLGTDLQLRGHPTSNGERRREIRTSRRHVALSHGERDERSARFAVRRSQRAPGRAAQSLQHFGRHSKRTSRLPRKEARLLFQVTSTNASEVSNNTAA